jgi:transcriptional regulator with XRE-family HTH domain
MRIGRTTLGARIREIRETAGISLSDAATGADISYPYLSDVERGRKLPTLEVLDAIASALDSTVSGLLRELYPWDSMVEPSDVGPPADGRRKSTEP